MPGFREHITGSTIVGVGYGAAAWYVGEIPPLTCLLGTGLCSVAGMLPDLDSGPGIPMRESVAFAAAVIPVMLLPRLEQFGLPTEALIIACGAIYLLIRFGVTYLLKNFSVHRGMFHSVPSAAIAGLTAFLAFAAEDPLHRYFVASAVVLGFLTHLILDEIWSVKLGMFGPKVKKSFGTAVKFLGNEAWANIVTYLLVIVLGALAANDAAITEKLAVVRQQVEQAARQYPSYPVTTPVYRR
ncbi:MAG: metal-dependent hydrolase [Pirellulales bacterium]